MGVSDSLLSAGEVNRNDGPGVMQQGAYLKAESDTRQS